MSTLAVRLDAAIRASGTTGEAIARALGITSDTVSRIRTGKEVNPTLQVLVGLARETRTTVGALLGETIDFSAEDKKELLRFRGWIDEKLATIDARQEPNAIIVSAQTTSDARSARVADRPRRPTPRIDHPFDEKATLVLRAVGDSMIGSGILADDTLYAIPTAHDAAASAIGKLIACRLGDSLFVKVLVSQHRHLFLRSADPRYRPIAIDANAESFEILGIVVGRAGRIG